MSLEDAIEKLTVAVALNNQLLQALADRSAANGATKPSTTVAPVEETVNSPVVPTAAEKRKPGRPPKSKTISEEQLRTAFGGYMAADKDPEVRKSRKQDVADMLKYFEVERATEIPEAQRQQALDYLAVLSEGGTPDYAVAADEDEDEDAMI